MPATATNGGQTSLLRLASPLILSFWMRSLFTFVDTAYAATLSDAAIAAIGLTIPLEFIFVAVWVGLSAGLTSYLSKAIGSKDNASFDCYMRTVGMMVACVVPLFVLASVGLYFLIPHLGLERATAENFQIYGPVLVSSSALLGFWSILPDSVVKAHHDTRSTMIAGIISNVINLVLNTFFLFVLSWGIFGIALSTGLGRLGGLIYALGRARDLEEKRRQGEVKTVKEKGKTLDFSSSSDAEERLHHSKRGAAAWQVLKLAIPSSVAFLLMATEGGLVNYLLTGSEDTTAALAAYSIFYRIFMFCIMPIMATSVAMLPFVARHFGAGNLKLILKGLQEMQVYSVFYSLLLVGPACWFGGEWLLEILADKQATVDYGVFAVNLVPFMCLASIPFILCRPLFEGLQQGRPTIVMSLLRYALLAPPLGLLGMKLAPVLGRVPFDGLMLGLLVANGLVSIAFLAWAMKTLNRLMAGELISRVAGGRDS